ncbi:hypothetical protein IJ425_07035 [bacterium]|nr:hypothetical protein [bacterium]
MSKKKRDIEVEIKVASGNSSKEEKLYHFVKLLHIIVEGEIEYLEQKGNKDIEMIKEYKEGIKDLAAIEEILETKFESH